MANLKDDGTMDDIFTIISSRCSIIWWPKVYQHHWICLTFMEMDNSCAPRSSQVNIMLPRRR